MNRRDALKKLGMGGATMVGVSAVVSSPAFAAGGSNGSQPGIANPTVTLTKNPTQNNKAEGCVTIPSRPCPVGTINPARLDYGISITGTALQSVTGQVTVYTTAPGSSIGCSVPVPANISLVWAADGARTVTVQVKVRWVCREANSSDLAWSCGTWNFPFTANNGGVTTALPPVFVTSTCDSDPT